MVKYRARSAEVLNEADAFQRVLEWQLFAADQEARLYDYAGAHPEISWRPGEPIYRNPRNQNPLRVNPEALADPDHPDWWDGAWGNEVRPMFELFDDSYPLVSAYDGTVCESCEVAWRFDGATCWSCGQVVPDAKRVSTRTTKSVAEVFDELFRHMCGAPYEGVREPHLELRRGFSTSQTTLDEARDFRGYTSYMHYYLSWAQDYVIDFNVEEFKLVPVRPLTPEAPPEGLEWIDKLYDPSRNVDRLPADVNWAMTRMPPSRWQNATPDIPMPVMPEPKDFSDWRAGVGTGPQERRRTRR